MVKELEFNQMLPDPVHGWDYWAVMPWVEAELERARMQRQQEEREENYNRAVSALGKVREVQAGSGLPPEIAGRIKRKPTDTAKIDALEPAMEELYSRGMSYRQIGAELGIHATTVRNRLEKRGVA